MKRFVLEVGIVFGVLMLTIAFLVKAVSATPRSNELDTSIVRLIMLPSVSGDGKSHFVCSGVVISKTLIATAAHCLRGAPRDQPILEVRDMSDIPQKVEASLLALSEQADYALLTGDFGLFRTREVETDTETLENIFMNKDANLIACGYPHGGRLVCSKVSKIKRIIFSFSALGFLIPGMSGGPVINLANGKVVAVNTAMNDDRMILSPLFELFTSLEINGKN